MTFPPTPSAPVCSKSLLKGPFFAAFPWLQCVTVTKMFNDTDTDTFFRYQIFSIPVLIPPEKVKNSRYRYIYGTGTHYKSSTCRLQNFGDKNQLRYQKISDTGSETFSGTKFTGSETSYGTKFSHAGSETFFWYQFFPIPPKKWKIPGPGTSYSAWLATS